MAHREEGISRAQIHGRGISAAMTDEFVGMYVNKWTLNFGDVGRQAVELFLRLANEAGLVPAPGAIDFIEPAAIEARMQAAHRR